MGWEDLKKLAERYDFDLIDPEEAEEDKTGTTEVWVVARGADPPPEASR